MELRLTRVAYTPDGTFGVLLFEGTPFAVTLERPWLMNMASEGDKVGSCIPKGTYRCKRVMSPKFGNTFEVTGVHGRSAILFHKGNLDDDSRGCILVGESFAKVSSSPGIASSAEGFAELLALLAPLQGFALTIHDAV